MCYECEKRKIRPKKIPMEVRSAVKLAFMI